MNFQLRIIIQLFVFLTICDNLSNQQLTSEQNVTSTTTKTTENALSESSTTTTTTTTTATTSTTTTTTTTSTTAAPSTMSEDEDEDVVSSTHSESSTMASSSSSETTPQVITNTSPATTTTTTTSESAKSLEEAGESDEEDPDTESDDESDSSSPTVLVERTINVAVNQVKPILGSLEKELNKESDDDIHVYQVVDEFGKTQTYSKSPRDTIEILNRMSKYTSLGLDSMFKETLPYLTSIGYESNITSSCLASILKLLTGLRKQEVWAFRLIDSFGRLSAGTFDGTVSNFGEYHECMDIDFPGDFEGIDDDESESESTPEEKVVGKYCLLRLDIPMPPKPRRLHFSKPVINVTGTPLENTILHYLSRGFDSLYSIKGFRFGICLPSTCSADEITSLLNKVLIPITKTPILIGPDEFCDSKNDVIQFNYKQQIAIAILAAFTSLALFSTLIDLLRIILNTLRRNSENEETNDSRSSLSSSSSSSNCSGDSCDLNNNQCPSIEQRVEGEIAEASITADRQMINLQPKVMTSKFWRIIFSFSIINSTKKLFHIRENQTEDTLSAVHGMRILSMVWIIIGHTYCFGGFYKLLFTFKRLSVDGFTNPSRFEYQPLINTFLLVDTFFFLGGVVLIYVALPMLQKHHGKFNYFIYAIHRWVRLTPAMLGSISFITIMPALGSGPYWKQQMNWQSEGCQKNWWMNLLYINNWVYPVDEMCGGMTWFVAADYQIYLFLAPIIFFAYYKSSTIGVVVNLIILIGGMMSTGLSTYIHDMAPTFGLQHTVDLNYLHEYAQFGYFPTYHHIAPYAMGTLIGYLIVRHLKKPIRLSKSTLILGWILTPIPSIWVLLCTRPWNDHRSDGSPSLTTSVVFSVLQRVLWTIGIAWVSFVCAIGQGGIVNKILSAKFFIPFSRLSYSIYMVHLIPIFLRANSLKYTRPWDDYEFISWGFFNILLGIIAAYILFIIFESPINSLEKIIFRGGSDESTGSEKKSSPKQTQHCKVECDE